MDPDAVLQQLRELAAQILANASEESDVAVELAEKVAELEQWLTGGGFLPASWNSSSRG